MIDWKVYSCEQSTYKRPCVDDLNFYMTAKNGHGPREGQGITDLPVGDILVLFYWQVQSGSVNNYWQDTNPKAKYAFTATSKRS